MDVYVTVMGQDVGTLRPQEQLLCERKLPPLCLPVPIR